MSGWIACRTFLIDFTSHAPIITRKTFDRRTIIIVAIFAKTLISIENPSFFMASQAKGGMVASETRPVTRQTFRILSSNQSRIIKVSLITFANLRDNVHRSMIYQVVTTVACILI